jgi:hypothetical protein
LNSRRGPSDAGTSRNDFTNPGLLPCRDVYAAPDADLLLYEGAAEAGPLSNGGTLSPRQLVASLSPRKTALRREQRQRHSSFLFRFRLFPLFSFPIGSSLTFRHNFSSLFHFGSKPTEHYMGKISYSAPQIRNVQSLLGAVLGYVL